jgi:hypothetical protein
MQVTIRQRQAGGARFFVDCEVQFSEEEKAIIYKRGLGKHAFQVPTGIPRGSGLNPESFVSRTLLPGIGVFCFLTSLLLFVIGIAAHEALFWAVFWLILAGGMLVFLIWADRRRRGSEQDQIIRIQQLLSNPVFTVFASDINQARDNESRIRLVLLEMKNFIMGNAQLKEVETFQL